MNLLGHDQVWSSDDWWAAVWVIPAVLVPAFLVFLAAVAATGNRDGELREAIKFGGAGVAIVGAASYVLIWTIIGICWLGGWL